MGESAEGALLGDAVFVSCVALVTAQLPVVQEETPESRDCAPGPELASLVCRTFLGLKARLLVIDDGLGSASTEEVLPPDGCSLL